MDLSIVASAFVLLFVAELGDKTQLMAMTLAHRFPTWPVVAGVFAAFLVLNLLAVVVGEGLYHAVPQNWVLAAAGALFLFFAWRSWKEADADEEDGDTGATARGAFITSFGLIFVAELGDKTQLALVAFAASTGKLWSVFIGGTLALWAVSAIGIILGSTVLRRLPKVWMHRAAALLFLAFGVLALGKAALDGATATEFDPTTAISAANTSVWRP
ncbi:MAG: TMEM165/GDT1 family protein [Pseudomonadota bacterium]|nr:MAG: TMEM165/GDT1 family protein [Pseudomonadota bacterium]